MATAAEVQTAYKAINRADLNDLVAQATADAINSGTTSMDAYIASQLAATASTTQAAVAISAFVTGVAPTSAHLDELKVAADAQVASYTAMGVGNPALGAYEAFGVGFSTTPEFTAKYGAASAADFINAVYTSVYGTAPTAAAFANLSAQIEYFTALYTGAGIDADVAAAQAKGAVLGQIVGYAFVSDASATATLDNQVASALTSFAKGDVTGYAQPLPASSGNPGDTTAFTTAIDVLKGGANNDTFIGDANTLTAADSVDGGAGVDTVKLVSTQILPTMTNVEKLVYSVPSVAVVKDLSGIAGLTDITLQTVKTGSEITAAAGVSVTFDATGTAALAVVAEKFTTAATATAATVGLANGSNITTLTVDGAAVKTLTINSTGTGGNTVGTLAGTAGIANSTLVVTGAAKLTVTNALDTDFKTVNASATTGGVSLAFGANDVAVTGGTGNDKFVFGANLTSADKIDGGAGTDVVGVAGANISAPSDATLKGLNGLTSIETIEFTGGATTVDLATLTNTAITKLLFNTAAAADIVNAADVAHTYAFGDTNSGAATINLKAGVLSTSISLEGSATTKAVVDATAVALNAVDVAADANAVATVHIASTGTAGVAANQVGAVTAAAGSTFTVTGAQDLSIASLVNKGIVDASAFTGKLEVTGSAAQDTIKGGAGADLIHATTGADTYTGGAGNDVFQFTAVDQGKNTLLTTITDFTHLSDKIDLAGLAIAGGFNATAIDVAAAPDFQGALNAAAADTVGDVNYFVFGGDTFVVADVNADNAFTAADFVVKLTGTPTLTAADVILA